MTFAWRPTAAPVASSRTDDIWFESETTGWAVNSNGQIIHTQDSGRTWIVQWQGSAYLRCIAFANASDGWCGTLTRGQRLLQTSNRGVAWKDVTNLPDLAPSAICGMSIVNERVVYASGTNHPDRPARMIKTTDGGASWIGWDMSPWADLLVDCHFLDELRGWVVGGKSEVAPASRANVKPVVLYTEDGGTTWTNRAAPILASCALGEWGWKIQFISDLIGFVSLESFEVGAILKTTDGGLSWERLPINDEQRNANLEGVGFVSELVGWVGGWGDADFASQGSSATVDGGRTWTDANFIGKAINRFRFFGSPVHVGYASGRTVYRYSSDNDVALDPRVIALSQPDLVGSPGSTGVEIRLPPDWDGNDIRLQVWNRFGEVVADTSEALLKDPGERVILWNLRDETGIPAPKGQYIVRTQAGSFVQSLIVRVR